MNQEKPLNGRYWTEDELAYLKAKYQGAQSIERIASSLDRSRSSVLNKAQLLGLRSKGGSRHKRSSQKELDYLEENWGSVNYYGIAKKLKRTPESVRVKAIRLGYANYQMSQDGLTLNELAAIIGTDYNKLRRWIDHRELPTFTAKITKNQQKIMINIDEFWKWARQHKELIDFSSMDRNALGAEPEWVDRQRKWERENPAQQLRMNYWTREEEIRLEGLVNEFKYTYREMAERLRRSESVIAQKLIDLDIKARPIKAEAKKWTSEETLELMKMIEEGSSKAEMAKRLKRSETAIKGKIRKMNRLEGACSK